MMHLAPIQSRNDFGRLLNERGLLGKAVEVGAHRGQFAAILLGCWLGDRLYCVDHWDVPPGYETQAKLLPDAGATRQDDFEAAWQALESYSSRVRLWRMTSASASEEFPDEAIDFVHLDADHTRPGIDLDLALWWPKLRPGGILAGHDFLCVVSQHDWGRFIQPAVLEFAERVGVDVFIVVESSGLPSSFYLEKPVKEVIDGRTVAD